MKKTVSILLGALMVIGLASFSLAQTKAGQTSKPTHKMFFGTVNAVTLADANGTKSEITATDKTNTKKTFLVVATATIYNAAGQTITLDKVQAGNKVSIKYNTTVEGVNKAKSIKILK